MVNIRTISRVSKFIREQCVHALLQIHLALSHAHFKHVFIDVYSFVSECSRVAIVDTAIRRIYFKVGRRLVGCAAQGLIPPHFHSM